MGQNVFVRMDYYGFTKDWKNILGINNDEII